MPMYKPLSDRSAELFVPNLNLIPPDTITLLETNQRFIEAYMVGLNHEMARELLWREYPTDQQGSYFRQFWDPTPQLSLPGDDRRASTRAAARHPAAAPLDAAIEARRARPSRSRSRHRRRGAGPRDPRRAAEALSHRRHLRAAREVGAERGRDDRPQRRARAGRPHRQPRSSPRPAPKCARRCTKPRSIRTSTSSAST